MYKINAVKLTFIPRQTVSNSTSSINNADNTARFLVLLIIMIQV